MSRVTGAPPPTGAPASGDEGPPPRGPGRGWPQRVTRGDGAPPWGGARGVKSCSAAMGPVSHRECRCTGRGPRRGRGALLPSPQCPSSAGMQRAHRTSRAVLNCGASFTPSHSKKTHNPARRGIRSVSGGGLRWAPFIRRPQGIGRGGGGSLRGPNKNRLRWNRHQHPVGCEAPKLRIGMRNKGCLSHSHQTPGGGD